ncbi:MAG: hypothetical protein JXR58_10385 [Bacteroidales bacterium]|nr:hypothetical protein [Bacteroidales bacterium]
MNCSALKFLGIVIVISFINCNVFSQNPPDNTNNAKKIRESFSNHKKLIYVLDEVDYIRNEAIEEIQNAAQNRSNAKELNATINLLAKFPEVKEKAERELKKLNNKCFETGIDALEYFEMANDLQFTQYKEVLSEIESSEDIKFVKQAKKLIEEANKIFNQAKELRTKAYVESNESKMLKTMIEAQKLEELAISKQEIAFSLLLNFQFLDMEPWYAKVETCFLKSKYETTENKEQIAEKPIEKTENIEDLDYIIEKSENSLAEKTIFKIQVGAFIGKVNEKEFSGIQPISIENIPNGFTKYLVGEYNSIEVARHAQKILRQTGFTDAFVVAYQNGDRLGMVKEKPDTNLAEK